jgi:prepilin-type N-terminal cleavage/methylation domain-containing protein
MNKSFHDADALRSAYTLVEIMIVVSIIGLLAVFAIPAVGKARMRSRDTLFIQKMQMIVDNGLEQIAMAEGNYPDDVAAGVEPAGVSDYIRRIKWGEPTPVGGTWDWDRGANRSDKVHGFYAGLSVIAPHRTSAQMQDIDSRIDDGDLETGHFRSHATGYIYILEE